MDTMSWRKVALFVGIGGPAVTLIAWVALAADGVTENAAAQAATAAKLDKLVIWAEANQGQDDKQDLNRELLNWCAVQEPVIPRAKCFQQK